MNLFEMAYLQSKCSPEEFAELCRKDATQALMEMRKAAEKQWEQDAVKDLEQLSQQKDEHSAKNYPGKEELKKAGFKRKGYRKG